MNNIVTDINGNQSNIQTIDKAVLMNGISLHDIITTSSNQNLRYKYHIDLLTPIYIEDADQTTSIYDKVSSCNVRAINDRNKVYKTFSSVGNLLSPRSNGCSSGSDVYSIVGGKVNGNISNSTEKFQVVDGLSIIGPNANISRMNHGCSGVKESMAIIGGINSSNSLSVPVEKLANNIFTSTSIILNSPRQLSGISGTNSASAHVIGGQDQTIASSKYEYFNGTTFVNKDNMSMAKTNMSSIAYTDNTILSIGGKNNVSLDICERYNTTWQYDSQLLVEVDSINGGGMSKSPTDMICVSGGLSNNRLMVATQLYNNIAWFVNSYMAEPRHSSQNSMGYSNSYIFGGMNSNGQLSSIEKLIDVEIYAKSKRNVPMGSYLDINVIKNNDIIDNYDIDDFIWSASDHMLDYHDAPGTTSTEVIGGGQWNKEIEHRVDDMWRLNGKITTDLIQGTSYNSIYTGGKLINNMAFDLDTKTNIAATPYGVMNHAMSGTKDNMYIMGGISASKRISNIAKFDGTTWSIREDMPIALSHIKSTYSEYINTVYSGKGNMVYPNIFNYNGSSWSTGGCVNIRRYDYSIMEHAKGDIITGGLKTANHRYDKIYDIRYETILNVSELITKDNAKIIDSTNIPKLRASSLSNILCGGALPYILYSDTNITRWVDMTSTEKLISGNHSNLNRELLPYYNSLVKLPLVEIRTDKKLRMGVMRDDGTNTW